MQDAGVTGRSHIVGMQAQECLCEGREVITFVNDMGIQSHQYISPGSLDAYVHGLGSCSARIVYQVQEGILFQIGGQQLASAVGTHTVHQQHFHILMRIVLSQYGIHA